MDELDESWVRMLAAAGEKAALQGRSDVAEYLRLKATNDAIRSAGVKWLLDAFIEAAFGHHASAALKVDRVDGHSFTHGASNMTGTRLDIRHGVRCLTIEAGWTRLPADGIMRDAALARANIIHFGRPRNTMSLRLVHGADLPEWVIEEGTVFRIDQVEHHISLLITD